MAPTSLPVNAKSEMPVDGIGNMKEIYHSGNEILKLDHAGLPLLPQPSTSPFDPLNYPNVTTCLIQTPDSDGFFLDSG